MAHSAVGRLLVASVTGDAWRRPPAVVARLATQVGPAELALAAEYHGIPGYVRATLLAASADPVLGDALLPAYQRGLHNHLRALSDLRLIDEVLSGIGVPYAVLKGPVLATRTHQRADLRAYSDLDILVAPPCFTAAVDALVNAGCRPVIGAFRALIAAQAGELPLVLPSGGALDLHWHTLNSPPVRAAFDVDVQALVSRAVVADVGGAEVPVLDASDTMVYVAMHMVLSGAHRLVWSKDVDQLVGKGPDWDRVGAIARSWRSSLVVAYALRHVAALLSTRVELAAYRAIGRPAPWSRLAAITAGLSRPEDAHNNRKLLSRVAARSTRYGVPSSLRELMRKAKANTEPRGLRPNDLPADVDSAAALAAFTRWADAQR